MTYDMLIKIQTRTDLSSWVVGKKILSRVFSEPKLIPQRAATFGEVTVSHGFSVVHIEDCGKHWASKAMMRSNGTQSEFIKDFHWKRNRAARSAGTVTFTDKDLRGELLEGSLLFESEYRKEIDWIGLFRNWCEITSPFAAVFHPLIAKDGPARNRKDVREYSHEEEVLYNAWFSFSVGTLYCEFRAGDMNSLVSGLTNLGWATWFGEELAGNVDMQLFSSAGFPVEKIGNGYLVRLTEQIGGVIGNYPLFSERRAALKSLFRPGLFLIGEEPSRNRGVA